MYQFHMSSPIPFQLFVGVLSLEPYLRRPILTAISYICLYSSSLNFLVSAGDLYSQMLPKASIFGFVAFTAFSTAGTRTFLASSGMPAGAHSANQVAGMPCL